MIQHARSALAVLLVTLASLSACGTDLDSDDPAASLTGRDPVVADALLTVEDLDGDFSRTSHDDLGLPEGTGISCVTDGLESTTPVDSAEVVFDHGEDGFPSVFNTVATYRDADEARRLMDGLRRSIEECGAHSESYAGLDLELDVADRPLPLAVGIDDQVAVDAQGSVGIGGVSLDVDLSLAVTSVGRRITVVGVADLDDDSRSLLSPYALLAARRLVASVGQ